MPSAQQSRAARGLLGWSARELAQRAGVHLTTVQPMERSMGEVRATVHTLSKVRRALEAAGVEFLNGNHGGRGVWLK